MKTEPGVRSGDINIIWITPNGDVHEAENRSTDGSTGRLNFSPLTTSDTGHYTCVGRILANTVGVNVSGNSSVDINVNSES